MIKLGFIEICILEMSIPKACDYGALVVRMTGIFAKQRKSFKIGVRIAIRMPKKINCSDIFL